MVDQVLKLAVASKEGVAISEHFGHARAFRIYEVTEAHCLLLETREVEHYCHGHHGSQSAMSMILQTISDCHAVFVARIGDGPVEKLANIGVRAVADYAYEAIEDSLRDYAEQRLSGALHGLAGAGA